MFLTLLSLSLSAPALAKDKPLKCEWTGDAVDAFTGKDARTMRLSFYGVYNLTFHRPADGAIPVDLQLTESGVTKNTITKPVMFLLLDGSVIELPVNESTEPSYGYGTVHNASGSLPLDAMKKIAEVGVTQMRFPNPTQEYTRELDKGDQKRLTTIARCLLEP